MDSSQEMTANKSFGRVGKLFMLLAGSISVVSLGAAVFFYMEYRQAINGKDPKQDEVAAMVGKIGKLMELPTGEMPTLATVADKEKLSEQSFFKGAENGDKILIYPESGRAILYRPSIGKIVDVTAIRVQNEASSEEVKTTDAAPEAPVVPEMPAAGEVQSEASDQAVAAEPAKVSFLNGSSKVGVTQAAEDRLMAAYPDGVEVISKEKASKDDYIGIVIADVTGRAAIKASEVAMAIGGTVGSLPAGETVPEGTDILVIVGNSAVTAKQ